MTTEDIVEQMVEQTAIKLHKDEVDSATIAQELSVSEDWVESLVEEYEEQRIQADERLAEELKEEKN